MHIKANLHIKTADIKIKCKVETEGDYSDNRRRIAFQSLEKIIKGLNRNKNPNDPIIRIIKSIDTQNEYDIINLTNEEAFWLESLYLNQKN